MKILVQNTLFDERKEYDLSDGEFVVGRAGRDTYSESSPDILIGSRSSSDKQALVNVRGENWSIQHTGISPTFVNDRQIQFGRETQLGSDDIVRIGEYLILRAGLNLAVTPDNKADDYQKATAEIESRIHDQLLDSLDLRRSTEVIDIENIDVKKKIKANLDVFVTEAVSCLDRPLMEYLTRHAVYRRLNAEITSTGDEARVSSYVDYENIYNEARISDVHRKIHSDLSLSLTKDSMRLDSDSLDSGFSDCYKKRELEYSEGLKSYLVSMHFKRNILDLVFGYGPLQDLLDTPSISEIMVISKDKIFVEKFDVVEDSRRSFYDDASLMAVIGKIVDPINRKVDASTPYVDARLPTGSRVNVIIPPLAVNGPCLTIRKFAKKPLTIDDLVKDEALDIHMKNFLGACVKNRLNIVVSGGTGSGKTTLLNCLSSFIGESERTITIEDTAELQLKQEHVVTLESKAANMEGEGAVTMRHLVKNALRMRPDRIVVGECRGIETLDMLQAMNTGHSGSMTTAHANSPMDMMKRLETMVLMGIAMPVSAIRNQITSAVDIVVQLNRLQDGTRKVTHVSEVNGIDRDTGEVIVEDIFIYQQSKSGGYHSYMGYIPTFLMPMVKKGLVDLDSFF